MVFTTEIVSFHGFSRTGHSRQKSGTKLTVTTLGTVQLSASAVLLVRRCKLAIIRIVIQNGCPCQHLHKSLAHSHIHTQCSALVGMQFSSSHSITAPGMLHLTRFRSMCVFFSLFPLTVCRLLCRGTECCIIISCSPPPLQTPTILCPKDCTQYNVQFDCRCYCHCHSELCHQYLTGNPLCKEIWL